MANKPTVSRPRASHHKRTERREILILVLLYWRSYVYVFDGWEEDFEHQTATMPDCRLRVNSVEKLPCNIGSLLITAD